MLRGKAARLVAERVKVTDDKGQTIDVKSEIEGLNADVDAMLAAQTAAAEAEAEAEAEVVIEAEDDVPRPRPRRRSSPRRRPSPRMRPTRMRRDLDDEDDEHEDES